jgi:hypothetical protein
MNKETGGPAFPRPFYDEKGHCIDGFAGMTLRDYFAAKAMQSAVKRLGLYDFDNTLAERAYWVADLMLKAREQ